MRRTCGSTATLRSRSVVPFPGLGAKWQVSNGGALGGTLWAGNELFYAKEDLNLYSVQWEAGENGFRLGKPEALFKIDNVTSGDGRDRQRFLVSIRPEVEEPPPVTLVTNWVATIEKRNDK